MTARGGLALLALSTAACAHSHVNWDYSKEYDPRKHEYVIGAGDQLQINVWGTPELSTGALVRPDGTITLPLLGDIQVSGKSPSEVKDIIAPKVNSYIKGAPATTVAVTNVQSYRFTVLGAVAAPGTFESNYYMTVADAIARAGGPTRFADTSNVELVRVAASGKTRRIPIDYDDIQDRKNPEANLTIVTGDTVFVP